MNDRINMIRNENAIIIMATILAVIFLCCVSLSPLLGFYIPLMFLCIVCGNSKYIRMVLILFSIYSASFFVASRNIFDANASDFDVYYDVYQIVNNGGTILYKDFSAGFEFFLPLFFKMISFILGDASPQIVLAVTVFAQLFLLYIWLEWDGFKNVNPEDRNLCAASTFGLLFIYMFSQILRQGFSSVFCLFAISFFLRKERLSFIIFYLLAISSHLTAIIIVPMFIIFMKNKKISMLICLGMFAFSGVFSLLLPFIVAHNLFGEMSYKFAFYTFTSLAGYDLSSYFKFLVITVIAGYFFFDNKNKYLKPLIYYGGLAYIALLPIPLASDRMLMVLAALLPGYILFFSFYKIKNIYKIILILFFVLKVMTYGPFYDHKKDYDNPMQYWYTYPWINDTPFYYIH
ncbi:TPA: O144 family O-antigen polymerase [Escherichia coli]|uniref:O-antigen polymerase n=1 Tax=Escherichia coli TaxID=562 RepID=A0A0A8J6V2_ECOLX|nr:O144 family O-antigen polymerase [Escherichia coli]AIG62452.1 O-antigen polymerase [Escherichia coli]EFK6611725.1 O144 family O-antigen polymerase [Escherichia coli]EFK6619383.1 O144 family O-antigen polymerase [Escherichia coli]EFK6626248.1 O144 family O-antigen polymerase [Escherichia coli]EGN2327361.1 O144 family O-antigen polymerase [Escherichia coli]